MPSLAGKLRSSGSNQCFVRSGYSWDWAGESEMSPFGIEYSFHSTCYLSFVYIIQKRVKVLSLVMLQGQ